MVVEIDPKTRKTAMWVLWPMLIVFACFPVILASYMLAFNGMTMGTIVFASLLAWVSFDILKTVVSLPPWKKLEDCRKEIGDSLM